MLDLDSSWRSSSRLPASESSTSLRSLRRVGAYSRRSSARTLKGLWPNGRQISLPWDYLVQDQESQIQPSSDRGGRAALEQAEVESAVAEVVADGAKCAGIGF